MSKATVNTPSNSIDPTVQVKADPFAVKNAAQGTKQPVQQVLVTEEMAGQRLDNCLMHCVKGLPKTLIYRWIRKGEVRIDGKRADCQQKLVLGQKIRIPPVVMPELTALPSVLPAQQKRLENAIIFEDKRLLVLNKPANWAVHGGSGVSLGIIEALRQYRPEGDRLELVHRLDRETSGCLLVASRRSLLRLLHAALREQTLKKTYLLLVQGKWPKNCRLVDQPLFKNQLSSGERKVRVSPNGQSAQTRFEVVKQFDHTTLVRAFPLTGRTHQIRVHAAFVGCPIVGDDKYAQDRLVLLPNGEKPQRLYLHSESITFPEFNAAPAPSKKAQGQKKSSQAARDVHAERDVAAAPEDAFSYGTFRAPLDAAWHSFYRE